MKVCISSTGKTTGESLDRKFGRCGYFIIADTESGNYTAIENEAAISGGGAGISAAQLVSEKGAEVVITGNVGPNAMDVLNAAGIMIYQGTDASVKENIESFKAGLLKKITENVPPHSGMGSR